MTLQLRSLQHPNLLLPLGASPVRVGRSSENELVIADASVSRHHAVIQLQNGAPVVSDLDSTRGTFINGARIKSGPIKSGDVVTFGAVQWRVETTAPAAAASAPLAAVPGPALFLHSLANPALQIPLTGTTVKIGRGRGSHVQIPGTSVSRRHAQIWFQNGQPVVSDLNSTRGTFINGVRVQSGPIKAGDVITFGDQQWQVAGGAPLAAARLPSRQFAVRRNLSLLGIGAVAVVAILFAVMSGSGGGSGVTTEVEVAAMSPAVKIQEPAAGAALFVNHAQFVLADVRDEKGIARVELWVDGAFVGARESDLADHPKTYTFLANWVPEQTGAHEIFVRAYSADMRVNQSNVLTVDVQPAQYVVQPGDTLESIAEDLDTTAEALLDANPQLSQPAPGSEVLLATFDTEAEIGAPGGDSIGEIADRIGIPEPDLRAANPGLPDTPDAGTPIILPNIPDYVGYVARPGDTWDTVNDIIEQIKPLLPDGGQIDIAPSPGEPRPPQPGETINLPAAVKPADADEQGTLLDADSGKMPPAATGVSADDSADCESVNLQWSLPQASALQGVQRQRIYTRAPGTTMLTLSDEVSGSATETTLPASLPGLWEILVGTVGGNGLENLSRVTHDTSGCGGESADGSPLELNFVKIEAPVDQLYCYLRAGGSAGLYQRVPEDDGNFITPSSVGDVYESDSSIQNLATADRVALMKAMTRNMQQRNDTVRLQRYAVNFQWPAGQALSAELACYGWAGGELISLGSAKVSHAWQEMDGQHHTLDTGQLRVEYSITPQSWALLGGRRILDPGFPVPFNLRQGPSVMVREAGQAGGRMRPLLLWNWEPRAGYPLEAVAGYQVIMREYEGEIGASQYTETVLDEVFDSAVRRSATWPLDDERACGKAVNLYVRALGYGPFISGYSLALTLDPVPCAGETAANWIQYGETVTAKFDGQPAKWMFNGLEGDYVRITAESSMQGMILSVKLLPAANIRAKLAAGVTSSTYQLPSTALLADGTYTILLIPKQAEAQGEYRITLEQIGWRKGSGHALANEPVDSFNVPPEEEWMDDPLWNLSLVEKALLVHGYQPGCKDSRTGDLTGAEYFAGLISWTKTAYPDTALTTFDWCSTEAAFTVIDRLADKIESVCKQTTCVIISHSTGGLYTTAALGVNAEANPQPWQCDSASARWPCNIKGHVALASAQGGTIGDDFNASDLCVQNYDLTLELYMVACDALEMARTQPELAAAREAGASSFRHRYIATKSTHIDNDNVLPTHSICGASDEQVEKVCGNANGCGGRKRTDCSDFRGNADAEEYFGNAESSYEMYECTYGGWSIKDAGNVTDATSSGCHGTASRNDGNIACQLFFGYEGWQDCRVARIVSAVPNVIYNYPDDDEIEFKVVIENRLQADVNLNVRLYTPGGGGHVDEEPDAEQQITLSDAGYAGTGAAAGATVGGPAGAIVGGAAGWAVSNVGQAGWQTVSGGQPWSTTLSSNFISYVSRENFGDRWHGQAVIILSEQYTYEAGAVVDQRVVPLPKPWAFLMDVNPAKGCWKVDVGFWESSCVGDDELVVADIKIYNSQGTPGEYKVCLIANKEKNGTAEVDCEPDKVNVESLDAAGIGDGWINMWKNGQEETVTLGTHYDLPWSLDDLGGGFSIVLYEENYGNRVEVDRQFFEIRNHK